MGWARWAWIAIPLLALAPGNATAADTKRVLLLHSGRSSKEFRMIHFAIKHGIATRSDASVIVAGAP